MTPQNAWKWAFGLVAAATALRMALAPGIAVTGDEAYHWLWSKHLAACYHEHPPLLAWLMAASTALLGDTRLALRLPSILGTLVLAWAVWRYAADHWQDRQAGARALWLLIPTPFVFLAGMYASTDMLFVGFFVAALWALAGDNTWRNCILFGLFTGAALLTKLIALVLLPSAVLALALSDGRDRLKSLRFWAGLGLALALFSPVILWNAGHGWPTILMRLGVHVGGQVFPGQYLLELAALELLVWSPLLLAGAFLGLPNLIRQWWRGRRLADAALLIPAASLVTVFVAKALYSRIAFQWPAAGIVLLCLPVARRWQACPRLRRASIACAVLLTTSLVAFVRWPSILPDNLAYPHARREISTRSLKRGLLGSVVGPRLRQELAGMGGRVFLLGSGFSELICGQFEAGQGDIPSMLRDAPLRVGRDLPDWWRAAEPRLLGGNAVYLYPAGRGRTGLTRHEQRSAATAELASFFDVVEAAPDLVVGPDGSEMAPTEAGSCYFIFRCRGYRGGFPG